MRDSVFQTGGPATELLDNHRCHRLLWQLHEFENAMFGSDFICDWRQARRWANSGSLFYAAISVQTGNAPRVLSAISLLVTTASERDRLLGGEIADYELAPWTPELRREEAAIYFSSVATGASEHLPALYRSLLRSVKLFRDQHRLTFRDAFGIASGEQGIRHMTRNGFRIHPSRYLQKYEIMTMNGDTAATDFWRELLERGNKSDHASQRQGRTEPCGDGVPSAASWAEQIAADWRLNLRVQACRNDFSKRTDRLARLQPGLA